MPWKERSVLDLRHQFVTLYLTGHYPKARLCTLFGISRPTGDLWLARYDPHDPDWAADRSHAPHACPQTTPPAVREAVRTLKATHPTWGPKKLRVLLAEQYPALPCPALSTLGALLAADGLVTPAPRPRPAAWPSPYLTPATAPNVVWCADYKGWFRLGNGQRCEPLTLTDGASRFLLACDAFPQPTGADVRATCTRLFATYGLPTVIRTDNGPPFASTAVGGLSRVSVWWLKLGIRPERIAPGRPQQNGQHERFHGTLTEVEPAADLAAQQVAFDAFRQTYNAVRPHEALGLQRPAQCYTPSPRALPATVPPVTYPSGMTVRHVRPDGTIKWGGALRFVSEALAGEDVGLWPLDDRLWVLYFTQVPLAVWDTHQAAWLPRKRACQVLRTLSIPAG